MIGRSADSDGPGDTVVEGAPIWACAGVNPGHGSNQDIDTASKYARVMMRRLDLLRTTSRLQNEGAPGAERFGKLHRFLFNIKCILHAAVQSGTTLGALQFAVAHQN